MADAVAERVVAAAPGKLVWLGEYAVLDGAPAVVCSVDRQVRTTLLASADARCRVFASNLGAAPLEFEFDATRIDWASRPDELELAARVIDAAFRNGVLDGVAPFDGQIDSGAFYAGQHKIGIGSSAAVAVALYRALLNYAAAAVPPPAQAFALLDALHRDFQAGRGSGVDVAAAVFGGVLEFTRGGVGRAATVETLTLPDDLFWCAVFCGRSASTAGYLARLEQARAAHDARIAGLLGRLGALSGAGSAALRAGDAGAFIALIGPYADGLIELGELADLDIFSREHRALRQLAADHQVAYKSSGAGGGDLGVGFAASPESIAGFRAAARRAGFVPLGLAMAPPRRWGSA